MTDTDKGRISKLYAVYCGKCEAFRYLEAHKKKEAYAEAKQRHWAKHWRYGWICPSCAVKIYMRRSDNF